MKEKCATFTNRKSKFLQNQRGEGDISVENLGIFFKGSGNVKKENITRNWTHKLPHKLPNNLRLMIVGNEELLIKALMIWCFNDYWTRGFELVTRGFEFQLVLLSFQLVTCNSQLVTRVLPYHAWLDQD